MKISVCCLILLSLLVESSFQLRAIFKQNPNAYQSGNLPSQNYIQQNANQPNQYVQPANSANSANQSNPYQPNSGYQQISGYQQAAPQQQPSQSQQTGYQQPAQSQPAQQKPAQQQQPSQSYQANYQQPAQQPSSQAQIQPCQASSGSAQSASSQSSYGQAQSANSAQSGYKIDPQPNLYCYSCNENSASCSSHYISADFLTPCNGQCIKFRNPNDKFKWYRGCSWDKGFNEEEPSVVYKDNTLYYFCNSSGCNA